MAKYIIVNNEFKKNAHGGYDQPTNAIGVTLAQTGPFPAIANRIFQTYRHAIAFLGTATVVPGVVISVIDDKNTYVSLLDATVTITAEQYNQLPKREQANYTKANGAYLIEFDHRGNINVDDDPDTLKLTKVGSDGKGTTYEAGQNIDLTDNKISAKGYKYDDDKQSFAEGFYQKSVEIGPINVEGNVSTTSPYINSTSIVFPWNTLTHAVLENDNVTINDKSEIKNVTNISQDSNGIVTITIDSPFSSVSTTVTNTLFFITNSSATEALGELSHAEGIYGKAIGKASHVEGTDSANVQIGYGYTCNGVNIEFPAQLNCEDLKVGNVLTNAHGSEYHKIIEKTLLENGNVNFTLDSAFETPTSILYKVHTAFEFGAHAEGSATASGTDSHAEGEAVAHGYLSHAEGDANAIGIKSHAEGSATASGTDSHAEGLQSVSHGSASHAEGLNSVAYGNSSHAEGSTTVETPYTIHYNSNEDAQTWYFESTTGTEVNVGDLFTHLNIKDSHVVFKVVEIQYDSFQNYYRITFNNTPNAGFTELVRVNGGSFGNSSHTEGISTIATNDAEHAEGKFNVSHEQTIHSIGIGSENHRKNAIEVMQNGDVYIQGIGNYDGTKTKTQDTNVKTLQEVIADISIATPSVDDVINELEAESRKDYVSYFESPNDADEHKINDIPFIAAVQETGQNVVCNENDKKLIDNDGVIEVVNDTEPVTVWIKHPITDIETLTTDNEVVLCAYANNKYIQLTTEKGTSAVPQVSTPITVVNDSYIEDANVSDVYKIHVGNNGNGSYTLYKDINNAYFYMNGSTATGLRFGNAKSIENFTLDTSGYLKTKSNNRYLGVKMSDYTWHTETSSTSSNIRDEITYIFVKTVVNDINNVI